MLLGLLRFGLLGIGPGQATLVPGNIENKVINAYHVGLSR